MLCCCRHIFISKFAGADGITVLNLVLPVFNVIFAVGSMIGVGSAIRFKILEPRIMRGQMIIFQMQ